VHLASESEIRVRETEKKRPVTARGCGRRSTGPVFGAGRGAGRGDGRGRAGGWEERQSLTSTVAAARGTLARAPGEDRGGCERTLAPTLARDPGDATARAPSKARRLRELQARRLRELQERNPSASSTWGHERVEPGSGETKILVVRDGPGWEVHFARAWPGPDIYSGNQTHRTVKNLSPMGHARVHTGNQSPPKCGGFHLSLRPSPLSDLYEIMYTKLMHNRNADMTPCRTYFFLPKGRPTIDLLINWGWVHYHLKKMYLPFLIRIIFNILLSPTNYLAKYDRIVISH
jgi:hypothetical protein